jgi:hypothetical protein
MPVERKKTSALQCRMAWAVSRRVAVRAAVATRALASSSSAPTATAAAAAGTASLAGRDNEGVDRRAVRPVVIIGSGPRYTPVPSVSLVLAPPFCPCVPRHTLTHILSLTHTCSLYAGTKWAHSSHLCGAGQPPPAHAGGRLCRRRCRWYVGPAAHHTHFSPLHAHTQKEAPRLVSRPCLPVCACVCMCVTVLIM